jgi:hypothetical protein
MVRIIAILFGIAFIFAGVAGFLPAFTNNGALFGIFEVDTMHNLVYIITGVIAIMAANSYQSTKLYFIIFGVIYTLFALLGFVRNGDLFIMHANLADNFLHLAMGILLLFLGYYASKRTV